MKKIVKIIILVLVLILVGFGSYFLSRKITENYINENLVVKDIKIKDFIDKFNDNLKKENISEKLELGNTIAFNKTFWLELTDNIDIAVLVDEEKEKKEDSIVRITALSYDSKLEKTKEYEKYLKVLIKTNNDKLSSKEIEKIIDKASDMSKATDKNDTKTSPTYDYKGLGVDKTITSNDNAYRIARYK